jgi:hypothetical protein
VSGTAGLALAVLGVFIVSAGILAADLIPATPRPDTRADTIDGHPIIWTDDLRAPTSPTITAEIPRDVIYVDLAGRARRATRAAEAQIRRRAGLQRQRSAALGLVDAIDQQLRALTEAETTPTPVVLDEQPTGGER